MSTVIEAAAVTTGRWPAGRSARKLADAAGRLALRQCRQEPNRVDLLINAGLYHDRNLGEPALAPLIQEDIGANPGDPTTDGLGTFSFDVANGTAGVLTALQIADRFLRAGTITSALIVASDADPGHGLAPDFPFLPAGGALVCRWTDRPVGLGRFEWRNRPDGGASFRTTVGLRQGRNLLTVERAADYDQALAGVAAEAAGAVLEAEGLAADDVSLVLAAPGSAQMVALLADLTAIPADRFLTGPGRLHTVSAISLIERGRRSGRMAGPATVLLVGAGAGLTAGAALYRA